MKIKAAWESIMLKAVVFPVPLFSLTGLSGFFPLHPMTVTEAERRLALAQLRETVVVTGEGQAEGEKQQEV